MTETDPHNESTDNHAQSARLNRYAIWAIISVLFCLIYVLSTGPVIVAIYYYTESTTQNFEQAQALITTIYYPLFLLADHIPAFESLLSSYVDWWASILGLW